MSAPPLMTACSFPGDLDFDGFAGFDFDGFGVGVLGDAGEIGVGGDGVCAGGDVVELEGAVGVEVGGAAPLADGVAGRGDVDGAVGGRGAIGFEDLALDRAG